MEELSSNARNKRAAIYGLLAGLFYIIVITVAYKQVDNQLVSTIIKASGFVLLMVLIGFFASRIKKANGGYLDFKKTFGVVFIMILICTALYYTYNYIYIEYIDPQYSVKLKAATLKVMEKTKTAVEVSKMSADMDKQITESRSFNLGNNLMNFLMLVLIYCLPGMVVALIVRKNKPAL